MNPDEKTCPRCAETIKAAAVVCRYCGHELGSGSVKSPPAGDRPAVPTRVLRSNLPTSDETKPESTSRTTGKIVGMGCLAFLVIAVIASLIGGGNSASTTASDNTDAAVNSAITAADAALANTAAATPDPGTATPASTWSYDTSRDDVRGKTIYSAQVTSDNEVDFDFPYAGGSSLTMSIRKHPQYGQDVIFHISKGQFVCGVESCSGAINFGRGAEHLSLTEPADYDSQTLFASNGPAIINKLKSANKVIVELPFYQEGNRQFTFETKGLKWPPSG